MGQGGFYSNQFRERLIAERTRRGWTQSELSVMMRKRGCPCYISTIGKLEAGVRGVRADELAVLADIFGTSVDALIGRKSSGGDLMWAVSKLTAAAQKAVGDISNMANRVEGDVDDVRHYAQFDKHSVGDLIDAGLNAYQLLQETGKALKDLANQFPVGSRSEE